MRIIPINIKSEQQYVLEDSHIPAIGEAILLRENGVDIAQISRTKDCLLIKLHAPSNVKIQCELPADDVEISSDQECYVEFSNGLIIKESQKFTAKNINIQASEVKLSGFSDVQSSSITCNKFKTKHPASKFVDCRIQAAIKAIINGCGSLQNVDIATAYYAVSKKVSATDLNVKAEDAFLKTKKTSKFNDCQIRVRSLKLAGYGHWLNSRLFFDELSQEKAMHFERCCLLAVGDRHIVHDIRGKMAFENSSFNVEGYVYTRDTSRLIAEENTSLKAGEFFVNGNLDLKKSSTELGNLIASEKSQISATNLNFDVSNRFIAVGLEQHYNNVEINTSDIVLGGDVNADKTKITAKNKATTLPGSRLNSSEVVLHSKAGTHLMGDVSGAFLAQFQGVDQLTLISDAGIEVGGKYDVKGSITAEEKIHFTQTSETYVDGEIEANDDINVDGTLELKTAEKVKTGGALNISLGANLTLTGNEIQARNVNSEGHVTLKNNDYQVYKCEAEESYFSEEEVPRNGDCGYLTFGLSREKAFKLLNENISEITYLISPVFIQLFQTDIYFCEQFAAQTDNEELLDLHDEYKKVLKARQNMENQEKRILEISMKQETITAFLRLEILELSSEQGWAHSSILHAIAKLTKVKLYIHGKSDKHELIKNSQCYDDKDNTETQEKHIVLHSGHFNKLNKLTQEQQKQIITTRKDGVQCYFLSQKPKFQVDDNFATGLLSETEGDDAEIKAKDIHLKNELTLRSIETRSDTFQNDAFLEANTVDVKANKSAINTNFIDTNVSSVVAPAWLNLGFIRASHSARARSLVAVPGCVMTKTRKEQDLLKMGFSVSLPYLMALTKGDIFNRDNAIQFFTTLLKYTPLERVTAYVQLIRAGINVKVLIEKIIEKYQKDPDFSEVWQQLDLFWDVFEFGEATYGFVNAGVAVKDAHKKGNKRKALEKAKKEKEAKTSSEKINPDGSVLSDALQKPDAGNTGEDAVSKNDPSDNQPGINVEQGPELKDNDPTDSGKIIPNDTSSETAENPDNKQQGVSLSAGIKSGISTHSKKVVALASDLLPTHSSTSFMSATVNADVSFNKQTTSAVKINLGSNIALGKNDTTTLVYKNAGWEAGSDVNINSTIANNSGKFTSLNTTVSSTSFKNTGTMSAVKENKVTGTTVIDAGKTNAEVNVVVAEGDYTHTGKVTAKQHHVKANNVDLNGSGNLDHLTIDAVSMSSPDAAENILYGKEKGSKYKVDSAISVGVSEQSFVVTQSKVDDGRGINLGVRGKHLDVEEGLTVAHGLSVHSEDGLTAKNIKAKELTLSSGADMALEGDIIFEDALKLKMSNKSAKFTITSDANFVTSFGHAHPKTLQPNNIYIYKDKKDSHFKKSDKKSWKFIVVDGGGNLKKGVLSNLETTHTHINNHLNSLASQHSEKMNDNLSVPYKEKMRDEILTGLKIKPNIACIKGATFEGDLGHVEINGPVKLLPKGSGQVRVTSVTFNPITVKTGLESKKSAKALVQKGAGLLGMNYDRKHLSRDTDTQGATVKSETDRVDFYVEKAFTANAATFSSKKGTGIVAGGDITLTSSTDTHVRKKTQKGHKDVEKGHKTVKKTDFKEDGDTYIISQNGNIDAKGAQFQTDEITKVLSDPKLSQSESKAKLEEIAKNSGGGSLLLSAPKGSITLSTPILERYQKSKRFSIDLYVNGININVVTLFSENLINLLSNGKISKKQWMSKFKELSDREPMVQALRDLLGKDQNIYEHIANLNKAGVVGINLANDIFRGINKGKLKRALKNRWGFGAFNFEVKATYKKTSSCEQYLPGLSGSSEAERLADVEQLNTIQHKLNDLKRGQGEIKNVAHEPKELEKERRRLKQKLAPTVLDRPNITMQAEKVICKNGVTVKAAGNIDLSGVKKVNMFAAHLESRKDNKEISVAVGFTPSKSAVRVRVSYQSSHEELMQPHVPNIIAGGNLNVDAMESIEGSGKITVDTIEGTVGKVTLTTETEEGKYRQKQASLGVTSNGAMCMVDGSAGYAKQKSRQIKEKGLSGVSVRDASKLHIREADFTACEMDTPGARIDKLKTQKIKQYQKSQGLSLPLPTTQIFGDKPNNLDKPLLTTTPPVRVDYDDRRVTQHTVVKGVKVKSSYGHYHTDGNGSEVTRERKFHGTIVVPTTSKAQLKQAKEDTVGAFKKISDSIEPDPAYRIPKMQNPLLVEAEQGWSMLFNSTQDKNAYLRTKEQYDAEVKAGHLSWKTQYALYLTRAKAGSVPSVAQLELMESIQQFAEEMADDIKAGFNQSTSGIAYGVVKGNRYSEENVKKYWQMAVKNRSVTHQLITGASSFICDIPALFLFGYCMRMSQSTLIPIEGIKKTDQALMRYYADPANKDFSIKCFYQDGHIKEIIHHIAITAVISYTLKYMRIAGKSTAIKVLNKDPRVRRLMLISMFRLSQSKHPALYVNLIRQITGVMNDTLHATALVGLRSYYEGKKPLAKDWAYQVLFQMISGTLERGLLIPPRNTMANPPGRDVSLFRMKPAPRYTAKNSKSSGSVINKPINAKMKHKSKATKPTENLTPFHYRVRVDGQKEKIITLADMIKVEAQGVVAYTQNESTKAAFTKAMDLFVERLEQRAKPLQIVTKSLRHVSQNGALKIVILDQKDFFNGTSAAYAKRFSIKSLGEVVLSNDIDKRTKNIMHEIGGHILSKIGTHVSTPERASFLRIFNKGYRSSSGVNFEKLNKRIIQTRKLLFDIEKRMLTAKSLSSYPVIPRELNLTLSDLDKNNSQIISNITENAFKEGYGEEVMKYFLNGIKRIKKRIYIDPNNIEMYCKAQRIPERWACTLECYYEYPYLMELMVPELCSAMKTLLPKVLFSENNDIRLYSATLFHQDMNLEARLERGELKIEEHQSFEGTSPSP